MAEPCPQGRTDYEACFAPFRYCPVKGCGRMGEPPERAGSVDENTQSERTWTLSRENRNASWTQNARGEWVPAIPLPFFGLRKRCECGRSFWRLRRYREHYAWWHILEGK